MTSLNMSRIMGLVHQKLLPGVLMHAYGFYMKCVQHEGGLRQHFCDTYALTHGIFEHIYVLLCWFYTSPLLCSTPTNFSAALSSFFLYSSNRCWHGLGLALVLVFNTTAELVVAFSVACFFTLQ